MVQLEEWIAISAALTLLLLSIAYLLYFKVTRKLFPQVTSFSSEIKPGEGVNVCKIEGSGIIKTVEIETYEKCIIAITIDGVILSLLTIGHVTEKTSNHVDACTFAIREQLNEKFTNNFTIHVQDQSIRVMQIKGKVHAEIKKGLRESLKATFSEIKG
jgi:hypothetical protein